MNEELTRGLVRMKLEAADSLLRRLPEQDAVAIRKLGVAVLDTVNGYVSERAQPETGKGGISKIEID